jgi:hypothetical protein
MQLRLWWCLWWVLAESAFGGSLESGGLLYVGAFGRNLASVAIVLVSFDNGVWHSQNKSRASFCKDNAAINCITVQHKKVSFHQV